MSGVSATSEPNLIESFRHGEKRTYPALVLCSGGVDSSTLLALACAVHGVENITALSICYGQKHARELESARKIAAHYQVPLRFLDLTDIFAESDCSLLAQSHADIPHETYAEQLQHTEGHPVSTYVPFRNGLFLSSAASLALSHHCRALYYGAHADDAAGNAYPDCTPRFIESMGKAIYEGSGKELFLEAPFSRSNKAGIVKIGLELQVPYELTWSCYEGKEKPCGVCGTCRDRIQAFHANGVEDPLPYD
ncbi:MAG: 7-cyano-7-deazaguanine synthase QueC [Eggerthellaceae bacterium]|jgi:7-cyano-7-deazaguanine synthase